MENGKEKIINTYDNNNRGIYFFLPKQFFETIKSNSVFIKEDGESLIIREAMIDDFKTHKIGRARRVHYTPFNGICDFIGEFLYEIEGETIVLTKK